MLESFHKKSRETGVKVGNKLRDQVIEAIEKLGNGFAESLDPDEFQNGKVKGFYAEILNIIYRLLFLMFAEQKGWLPVLNSIYARTYSLNALREMAERGNYSHDEENDLWEGLKITFKLVANGYEFKNGDKINAFGGQLFSDKKIAVIKDLPLKNKFLLDAIFRLSYFKLDKLSNRINYANLAIDELGSVYESLLDYEPKLAKEPITINKREIKRGEFYLDDRGTDRKTTGSYYTDSRLVAQLIESALVPVINNALTGKNTIEEKEQALLDLKVADIACGSGAFICAALEKMGEQLARIRMGDEDRPTEDQLREAKRDVLLHCIYGVDLNPMALELAKFSLWITASLPDMPLTFLDHKLKCGNSLIGATPELIKKGIPEEAYKPVGNDNPTICTELKKKVRREQESMSRVNEPTAQYSIPFKRNETDELLRLREVLNNRKQEQVSDVDLAEEEFHQLEKMEHKFKDWLMADVWTSAFFIEKTELDQKLYPTNITLENLRENQPVNDVLIDRVLKTADHYNFFHYHLEFPEVFEKGGFDCLLGNPPWENIRPEEKMFFKQFDSDIVKAKGVKRKQIIKDLVTTNPQLHSLWTNHKTTIERSTLFFKNSDFPLMSNGSLNTYTLFSEKVLNSINDSGAIGYITPTGICTDNTTQAFFRYLIEKHYLKKLYDFENRNALFHSVHRMFKFCLISISKTKSSSPIDFSFYLRDPEELNDPKRHFSLSPSELLLLNPNTGTATLFRSQKDAEINLKVYKRNPVLLNERTHSNPFQIQLNSGHYHMTADSKLFHERSDLEKIGAVLKKNIFKIGKINYLPLFEAKMIYLFNHRYGTYENVAEDSENTSLPSPTISDYSNHEYEVLPRYWIKKEIEDKEDVLLKNWYLGFRDITNATNERTVIIAPIANCVTGHKLPFIYFKETSANQIPLLFANLCSFSFDYFARQKVSATNLTFFIFKQLPIVNPASYNENLIGAIKERILKLAYTSHSLSAFASEMGYYAPPFYWNDKERFQIQCELDAIYAHLYGLEKEEMDYILETFPIVKRKDIAKYGSYRTKETILQLYDAFAWVRDEMKQSPEAHE